MINLKNISVIATEKRTKDSKVNRLYYTATFTDPTNPFKAPRSQNVFQVHNEEGTEASWKAGDPAVVSQFIGKNIPGAIVETTVVPYGIKDAKAPGGLRMVKSATCVVIGDVSDIAIARAFKANGFIVATATAIVEEPAMELSESLND